MKRFFKDPEVTGDENKLTNEEIVVFRTEEQTVDFGPRRHTLEKEICYHGPNGCSRSDKFREIIISNVSQNKNIFTYLNRREQGNKRF
jgi:hypothetical protein